MSYVQIHTSKMTLADDVNLEEFVMTKDEFSGADIKAICTEAGLLALRERRMTVRLIFFLLIQSFCLFLGMYKYRIRSSSHLLSTVTIWNRA
jgi:SpoVK/Ycf46/Vps4 family AAA+-type ATPase